MQLCFIFFKGTILKGKLAKAQILKRDAEDNIKKVTQSLPGKSVQH